MSWCFAVVSLPVRRGGSLARVPFSCRLVPSSSWWGGGGGLLGLLRLLRLLRHLAISPSCRASRGRRPCFCSPGGPHAVASRASSRARASAGSSSSGTLLVAKCATVWRIVAGLLARGAGVSTRLSSLPFSTTTSRVACTGGVGYPVCPAGGARTMLLEGDRRALRLCIEPRLLERHSRPKFFSHPRSART